MIASLKSNGNLSCLEFKNNSIISINEENFLANEFIEDDTIPVNMRFENNGKLITKGAMLENEDGFNDTEVDNLTVLAYCNLFDIGEITEFAGDIEPTGFKFCRGQVLNINEFQNLYSEIGTLWNIGEEEEGTFRLPNLQERALIGCNDDVLVGQILNCGAIGGTLNHTHETIAHTHGISSHYHNFNHSHSINHSHEIVSDHKHTNTHNHTTSHQHTVSHYHSYNPSNMSNPSSTVKISGGGSNTPVASNTHKHNTTNSSTFADYSNSQSSTNTNTDTITSGNPSTSTSSELIDDVSIEMGTTDINVASAIYSNIQTLSGANPPIKTTNFIIRVV